jgi:hypothetical protein
MPPKAKKPIAGKKGKPKAKVKKEPPPPPPPPPPDPRLLLVDELIPQYSLAQVPEDPSLAIPGYEGDVPPYALPGTPRESLRLTFVLCRLHLSERRLNCRDRNV